MARYNNKNNEFDFFKQLFLLFSSIGVVIKWIIDFIAFVIGKFISFIIYIDRKITNKETSYDVLKKPFKDSNAKYKEKEIVTKESIIKKLNLFNMDIYDDMFSPQIRKRGEEYYEEDKIKYFKQNNNKYTCRITGTDTYRVSILFNNENNSVIDNANCTCPYHKEDNKNCKHIYALLLKIKCEPNKKIILSEISKNVKGISEMIENAIKDIGKNLKNYDTRYVKEFTEKAPACLEITRDIKKHSLECNSEKILIEYLINLLRIKSKMQDYIKCMLNSEKVLYSDKENVSDEEKSIDLDFLFERKDKVQNEYDNVYGYTKEQLEHLEPWQLELVKKGEYDPSGFEEQDLEDDDWHSDDEDETIK